MLKSVDLREVMRRWVSGVAILTTGRVENHHGMTVSSFTSVSIEPPMVTVTLNNTTRTKNLLDKTSTFAINLLSEDQKELSERFAGRVTEMEDFFQGLHLDFGEQEIPILSDAAACIECKVVHTYAMRNSTLYIGEVLRASKAENLPPLVYFDRDYHRISQ